jgi:hypothetical protein
MSAPPLPEAFGNYALGDFAEVVAPPAISWLPQTAGWKWVGILLLAAVLYRAGRYAARWYRNRYRREAAARIRALPDSADPSALVAELNRLLKLTTLAAWPREDVARLSGDEWVNFLNRQCPAPAFDVRQSQLLATGAYCPDVPDVETRENLLAASLAWVEQHRNPRDA